MKNRTLIFVHHAHIQGWINSCYTLEQLHTCENAINSFKESFQTHGAVTIFVADLETILHNRTTDIENFSSSPKPNEHVAEN